MIASKKRHIPNILVVDDTPANVLLLVMILTERGYNARSVLSGALALEAARIEPPDLILLDIAMPGMSGYEVCIQLKADPALKSIPVIFISALSETMNKVKAFNVGAVDYVTKPFQFEEVFARVQTHLELRRLEKLRDDLTHMVVHDLRNPLSVIFGFLDMLEGDLPNLSPANQSFLPLTRICAEELFEMISSILDVSQIGDGKMKLQRGPCDLAALIKGVIATTQLFGERTVSFQSLEAAPVVTADEGLIRRIMQNLLGNAIKHSPAGGNVNVAVTLCGNEFCVAVTDSGPGIEPEYRERIFEKFAQLEQGRKHGGSGLGLTFCKLAIEAHGGRIGVESEVGKGSTFWWALPRLQGR